MIGSVGLKNRITALKNARLPLFLIGVGLLAMAVLAPLPAQAGLGNVIAQYILMPIAQFLGGLTLSFIGLLVQIVQYNDFIYAPAVVKGWVVMRDVVNMLFIVILLAIAFGTVFKVEQYQYKQTLGKVLLMAVLVNFSKGITGLFIDIAQVVMLTFVNGFKDAAAGNFVNGFQMEAMFNFAKNSTATDVNDSTFFYAALLALISIAITTVVVGVYLIIFVLRIAVLWLLIITSPLAYVASAFPGESHLKQEAIKWWDFFGRYAVTGPLLAFFLWLSLAVMQFGNSALGDFAVKGSAVGADMGIPAAAVTGIGQSDILLSFIVNIVLLLGGLYMASTMGVAGGKLAGAALQGMQHAGAWAAKNAALAPFRTYGWAARKVGAGKVPGLRWLKGFQLNPVVAYQNYKAGKELVRHKEEAEISGGAEAWIRKGGVRGLAASFSTPDIGDNLHGFLYLKTIKGLFTNAGQLNSEKIKEDRLREEATRRNRTDVALDHVRSGGTLGDATALEKANDINALATSKFGGDTNEAIQELKEVGGLTIEDLKALDASGGTLIEQELAGNKSNRERLEKGGLSAAQIAERQKRMGELNVKIKDSIKVMVDQKAKGQDTEATKEAIKSLYKEGDSLGLKHYRALDLTKDGGFTGVDELAKANEHEKKANAGEISMLEKEAAKLKVELKSPDISPAERLEKIKQADDIRESIQRQRAYMPQSYYARAAARAHVAEEKKKIDTTNEDELISMFHDAEARHDVSLAQAILSRATEVGHLNELVQEYNFNTDVEGLHGFMNEIMVHKFHMKDQEAYALENDLSNVAEEHSWWTFGQAMTVENGQFRQRTYKDQQMRCYVEMGKRDLRNLLRQGNRGAWMHEYWKDPLDHSKGRYAVMNETLKGFIRNKYGEIQNTLKRGEVNPNLLENLNSEQNMKIVHRIGEQVKNDIRQSFAGIKDKVKREQLIEEEFTKHWGVADQNGEYKIEGSFLAELQKALGRLPNKEGGVPTKAVITEALEIGTSTRPA